jgi:hypothetical protein
MPAGPTTTDPRALSQPHVSTALRQAGQQSSIRPVETAAFERLDADDADGTAAPDVDDHARTKHRPTTVDGGGRSGAHEAAMKRGSRAEVRHRRQGR